MKRLSLLSLLSLYKPADIEQQKHKQTIINFITNNVDCFERSLLDGHIVASAFLLNKEKSHALLMHHKKLNLWIQLGGHCDGNPDVLAVALKEAQEESGIMDIAPITSSIFDIDVHLVPSNPKEQEHYHYDIRFLLQVMSNETIVQNAESHALEWFSIKIDTALLPTSEYSVIRLFEKASLMP